MSRYYVFLISAILSLISCKKDEDSVPQADYLMVVTSASGLGDMGYNDQIMSGIMNFYEANEVSMNLVRPNKTEEAKQTLQKWQAETKDKGKSLLVLAGNEYETLVTTGNLNLSKNQQILLFES